MTEKDQDQNQDKENYKIGPFDKLVIDIRNNLTTRLEDLMSKLLNSAQDRLFDMSNEADNNEDSARYFELMNQVRQFKPDIAVDFNGNIKKYLVPAAQYDRLHASSHDTDDEDELSLVGQDEMEGMVLVKSISSRAAGKYREQLSHLEARLEHLATKTDNVFRKDALVPNNICQAFNDALPGEISHLDRKLLFDMFDEHVANKLDALYDSINNRLIDADILPQIKLSMGKSASRPKRAPQPPPAEMQDQPQDDQSSEYYGGGHQAAPAGGYSTGGGQSGGMGASHAGGPGGAAGGAQGSPQGDAQAGSQYASSAAGGSNISGFAMTAAPGSHYRNQAGNTGAQPAGQEAGEAGGQGGHTGNQPAGVSGGMGGQPAPGQGGGQGGGQGNGQGSAQAGEPGTGEFTHYTAGIPASQVGRVLNNYIGTPFTPETTSRPAEQNTDFYPQSSPTHFGHQEIIQALSSVQNLPQFVQTDKLSFDGEAIKQAVLAEIARKSGGAVTKRINTIAEKTIDFIELIFDAIIDDDDISDTIKALLLRLQIPIIKASMSDQEFFIYDDHPARVLLDSIAEVGVGVTEHTDDIYIQLDKIVSNILADYELSTETFQQALDKLNAFIEEQETITRVREEEEQQQLLRKHARATVLKSLRASTTGKTLPEAVHPLILKRWPTLMFNHFLSNGKENNEWINLVFTLRHIVEIVQPVITVEQLARIKAEKDALFDVTRQYLSNSSSSKKDVQNVMDAFITTVQEHIDDANFDQDEVSKAEQTAEPIDDKEEIIDQEKVDKPEIPANVMPGMWFQLYMGENEPVRRCKLSVIIVEDAKLMFVNHKGELLKEKTFDEFNEEVASNKTKMIMSHSAFDHAFKSVINRLD